MKPATPNNASIARNISLILKSKAIANTAPITMQNSRLIPETRKKDFQSNFHFNLYHPAFKNSLNPS